MTAWIDDDIDASRAWYALGRQAVPTDCSQRKERETVSFSVHARLERYRIKHPDRLWIDAA